MFAKSTFMFAVLTVAMSFGVSAGAAEDQKFIFQISDVSVTLSNFEVVTGEYEQGQSLPKNPMPLPADKLMPPETSVWIVFDFESNFETSEEPTGPKFLAIGIEAPKDQPWWGYNPMGITEKKGRGAVRMNVIEYPKVLEVDHEFKLNAFIGLNDGRRQTVYSGGGGIPVKFRRDGTVTLSITQFTEIQAMLKKVAELEKRVKALEGKKKP